MSDKELKTQGAPARGVLSSNELSVFCMQLAMVMRAGIPLYEGIPAMHDDMNEGRVKTALGRIAKDLAANKTLNAAMRDSGMFPEYIVNMTEVGEASGNLDSVMQSLSEYYDREQSIRTKIKNAVVYPMVLFLMMTAVIVLLVIEVFPLFNNMFKQLGGEMGGSAAALMSVGMAAGTYTMWVVIALAVLIAAGLIFYRTSAGKKFFDRFAVSFGPTRQIALKLAAGRFSSAMALMLSSGLDTGDALDLSSRIIGNTYLKEKIARCRKLMDDGADFTSALDSTGIYPVLFVKMVQIGEKTGSSDMVMKKLADIYEDETENALTNLISLIEPVLVAILSIVVGVILVSVMLPLISIMSSIG